MQSVLTSEYIYNREHWAAQQAKTAYISTALAQIF